MPRINIEDSIYLDNRFSELTIALGSKFTAIGCLVSLWSVGQEYWKRDKSLIPKDKFIAQRFPTQLVELGFVIEKPHGFLVEGAEKQFAWLLQKTTAGKKGGLSKNKNLGPSDEKRKSGAANPLSLTHSLTLSKKKKGSSKTKKTPEEIQAKELRSIAWSAYFVAYRQKYKSDPIRDRKANTHIKQICDRVGKDAPKVLVFYLKSNKNFYLEKAHELGLCVSDLQALVTTMKNGVVHQGGPRNKTFEQQTVEANQNTFNEIDSMGGNREFD